MPPLMEALGLAEVTHDAKNNKMRATRQVSSRASVAPAGDPFEALGDPNRRAIVELLGSGGRSVRELADALPISRPAVSRHLRLLKEAGLVVEEPRGTRRIYRLHDEGVEAVRGLSRAGLGRGGGPVPAGGREYHARAMIEPIRLAFEVDAPPAHAFEVWTGADRPVVAGRSHGVGRGRARRRPRAAARRTDLRTDRGRDRARMGRGHGLGAAQPFRLPVAPPPRPRRCDRGRDPVPPPR